MKTAQLLVGLLALAAGLFAGGAPAQGVKKSDAVVKVRAEAGKPGADGKQTVTVTLHIEKGWHLYANPVGNQDLADAQTTVAAAGKGKVEIVDVDYPEGKVVQDKVVGDYNIYEDKVAIKATVRREKGEDGPLKLTVKFQACNDKSCLLPASVDVQAD